MRLYMIRHGHSLENIGHAKTPNCGLSELGVKQAVRLADFSAMYRSERSSYRRTIHKMLPLAESKELPIRIMPEIGRTARRDGARCGKRAVNPQ